METRQGRLGPISSLTNEMDGELYIVSTISCRTRGLRITGKELEGFNPDDELVNGFNPEFIFDVIFQTCVYKVYPKREKIFFIDFTDFDMPMQTFHTLIVDLLMKNSMKEMYGALCEEKYERVGYAAVPVKLGFLHKKQHVFLVKKS